MATIPVTFTFMTGIRPQIFGNARLHGSWDAGGRYAGQWSERPMHEIVGEDGCRAFTARVDFDEGQAGEWFHWGVSLDGPAGSKRWAIMTEVNDHVSHDRHCSFQLQPAAGNSPQDMHYYLNESRRLGAQKYYRAGQAKPGIRFSVWAPNALAVEVVMAKLWDEYDSNQIAVSDPAKTPATQSLTRCQICGGYIADDGSGTHPAWGPFSMTRQTDGIWVTDIDAPELNNFSQFDHSPFMFKITKDDGSIAYRTDLYSRCQIGFGKDSPVGVYTGKTLDLNGTVSCSVVVDPDQITKYFTEPVWPELNWEDPADFWADEFDPAKPVPRKLEDLVIYELHVGALGFGKSSNKPGTLEDALAFLDHLVALGVNAVELLPMSEFGGGGGGWGYSTSHYFAIEYSGGGRDNYKWFVRECHKRGIAVILDVVYNHYNHNAERAEWMYDTNSHEKNFYYWYEGNPSDYPDFDRAVSEDRRGTGGYLDNISTAWAPRYYEEQVRKMFVSSAVTLVTEFHVDGFRVDQTTSIHAYNSLHANGHSVGSANVFGQKLLRELTRTLKFIRPDIMLMAEDHSNWDQVTQPSDGGGGLGFDATWYADFYHHLIGDTDKGSDYAKLIKTAGIGDDRPLAMDVFASVLQASGSRKVVYHESHDEAGNGHLTHRTIKVAVNEAPLIGETRKYAEARCRFATGISILSAGTPMFLFGEEVGAEKDYLYGRVLENREDLVGLRNNSGRNLFEYYRAIIHLRLRNSALRSHSIDVVYTHNANRIIAFRRWHEADEFLVIGSLNNHPYADGYTIENQQLAGKLWGEVFNSDSSLYGGDNIGNMGAVIASVGQRLNMVLPANGIIVLRRQS